MPLVCPSCKSTDWHNDDEDPEYVQCENCGNYLTEDELIDQ